MRKGFLISVIREAIEVYKKRHHLGEYAKNRELPLQINKKRDSTAPTLKTYIKGTFSEWGANIMEFNAKTAMMEYITFVPSGCLQYTFAHTIEGFDEEVKFLLIKPRSREIKMDAKA